MSQPLVIGLPQSIDVGANYTLRVTAIDPTTGNATAGVKVDTVVLSAASTLTELDALATGQWFLVPGPGA